MSDKLREAVMGELGTIIDTTVDLRRRDYDAILMLQRLADYALRLVAWNVYRMRMHYEDAALAPIAFSLAPTMPLSLPPPEWKPEGP